MRSERVPPSSPGVHFPPPFVFVAAFALAWLLEARVARLRLMESAASAPLVIGGTACIVAGLIVIPWSLWTFWRARTGVLPFRPASRIVTTGPYRFSRNPMYVGVTLLYVGLALRVNWGWPLLLLPTALLALYYIVIRREERYLRAAFPGEYDAYTRRVRRWL